MNKKHILPLISVVASLSALTFVVVKDTTNANKNIEANAYSAVSTLPTTIDLNDATSSDIKSYYSTLTGKSSSELQGTNLLKNLKTILKNGQKYNSYDTKKINIWKMYEIIDRDWTLSPASSISGYSASTNKITGYSYGSSTDSPGTNPYVHSLYTNRSVTNQANAWSDHTQTNWGINQEHIWPKSQGFEAEGSGGARGDVMHLWAGNGYANNLHSNHPYGYVDKTKSYTNCGTTYSYLNGNLLGQSKTLTSNSGKVFEPQDSDKGDIARAIFYMAARYNYYSGSDADGIDEDNPNLVIVQSAPEKTSYTASTTVQGEMGILSDLLEWNKIDPPDEFEIHRNNLCYNNYTGNRNPFIDYPEWANYIWGTAENNTYTSSNPTGYVDLAKDVINGWRSSSSSDVTIELDKTSASINVNGTVQLTATCSDTSASISWTTANASVATVNNGLVTGVGAGSTTITASTTIDNQTYSATCAITVTTSSTSDETEATIVFASGESDSSTAYTTSTFIKSAMSSGASYVSSVNTCTNVYKGKTGLKFGTGKYNGDLKLSLASAVTSKKVTSISFNCAQYGSDTGNFELYINGSTTKSLTVTPSSGSGTYTFTTPTTVSSIEIKTSANRAYLIDITFTLQTTTSNVDVTGVSLDKATATIDLDVSDTLTLTATVAPSNATDKTVTWTSSNTSVATVNNGLVTALATGTATITVTTTDGNFSATCVITVTGTTPLSETSTVTINTSDYTPGYDSSGTTGTISKTVSSTSDLSITYSGINTQSSSGTNYGYAMYVSNKGYIYNTATPDSYYPSKIKVTFSSGTGTSGKIGASFASSAIATRQSSVTGAVAKDGTYESTNSDQSLCYWNISTTGANVQIVSIVLTYSLKTTITIANFVSYFNDAFTCDSSGNNTPSFNSGYTWATIKTKYELLSQSDQTTLKELTYTNEEITTGTDAQKVVAKYDYIIAKYGTTQYTNFMNRTISAQPQGSIINKINNDSNFVILITICLVILTAGVSIFLNRKKND